MGPRGERLEQSVSQAEEAADGLASRPIALFTPGLGGGGAERVFVTLANTFVTMTDHPIHLVTLQQGEAFERLVDPRVVRVALGAERVSRSLFRLVRYIQQHRPVAMMSTQDYCNVVFLVASRLARVQLRKVIRPANVLRDETESFAGWFSSSVMRALMRLTYRWADDIIIITEDVARSFQAHRIGNPTVMRRIPNPVWRHRAPVHERSSSCPHSKPFILGIGRLSYQKGFDTLLCAFAQLKHPTLDLVLLGDGPLKPDLEALAVTLGVKDRVVLAGFVDDPSVYLRAAALFVLASRWEGFPNVLTEALASGVPVVSTDCPGSPREVLQNGLLGRLVPVDDCKALAFAISEELTSPVASNQARVARAGEYSADSVARKYLAVMLECSQMLDRSNQDAAVLYKDATSQSDASPRKSESNPR